MAKRLYNLLQKYQQLSGQQINFQKSLILFPKLVPFEISAQVVRILSWNKVDQMLGKYLDIPCLISKSKKQVFSFISDRIDKKVRVGKTNAYPRLGRKS